MNKFKDSNSLMIINNVFPVENNLTPILGNVIKGSYTIGDKVTIIRSDNQCFQGIIEKIKIGKEMLNSIGKKEKIIMYLKNVSIDNIKNTSIIDRNAIIK